MQLIIEYGRSEGLHAIHDEVLRENMTMLEMCRSFGLSITSDLHVAGSKTKAISIAVPDDSAGSNAKIAVLDVGSVR
jgi:acetyltransferase